MEHVVALELDKAVTLASRLWGEMVRDRMHADDPDRKSPVHYDQIDTVLTRTRGTVKGELLQMAVRDAKTRPLPTPGEGFAKASREMRSALDAERHRLAPPPALVTPDQSTACRHAVAYADVCAACDAEFA